MSTVFHHAVDINKEKLLKKIQKNHTKTLSLKSMTEMKNLLEGFNSKLGTSRRIS